MRNWLRRLERLYSESGEHIEFRLRDGTIARYTLADLREACQRSTAILEARKWGEPEPEPHELTLAFENAADDEQWTQTWRDILAVPEGVPDLSEP